MDRFIDIERFVSQRKIASGRSRPDVTKDRLPTWRRLGVHHKVEDKGRVGVFENYHLRVGEITADTEVPKGPTLREQRLGKTEIGEGKRATVNGLSL